MWRKGNRGSWSSRVLVASLVMSAAIGLFGVGALLSNTYGAAGVADNALALHWTNATLGTSGIARASVAQAVFFSFEEVSNEEAARVAIAEARSSLAAVSSVIESPDVVLGPAVVALARDLVSSGEETVALAEAGDAASADAVRLTQVEPTHRELESLLLERQTDLTDLVAASDQAASRISRITFVAISFIIPAITMMVFWILLRRSARSRERDLQVRIEAEKQLNAAKDQFIAGLSHELRTPLTTIVGFSEILMDGDAMSEDTQEQLALIHGSSADLTRMVEDLLTAARLDAGALTTRAESFDLRDAIDAATSSYVLTGRSIEISAEPIQVYADSLHVRQIVQNLVSNAFRHGGENVAITSARKGSNAFVTVVDDGPGVPRELEERLFRRFIHEGRQALVAGSVGLGLAISQELARRMGGALRYQRSEGLTSFTLLLPTVPEVRPDPDMSVVAEVPA